MMEKLGLDVNQMDLLPYLYDVSAFYSGEADMTIGYTTGTLLRIRKAGYDVNVIWPNDYGVHLYADTIFTTQQMIDENPELVTRFLNATLHGWQAAIEDPAAAVEDTLKYAREADRTLQTEMMDASVPLIFTGQDNIGWMKGDQWQAMYDILLHQHLLDRPFNVGDAYTLEFLDLIYGGG